MLNCYSFVGRLVEDPKVYRLVTGAPFVVFGIAVEDVYYTTKEKGGMVKYTVYIECNCVTSAATYVERFVRKGDMICGSGKLMQDRWIDKETGKKRSRLKVRIRDITKVKDSKRNAEREYFPETYQPVSSNSELTNEQPPLPDNPPPIPPSQRRSDENSSRPSPSPAPTKPPDKPVESASENLSGVGGMCDDTPTIDDDDLLFP